MSGPVTPPGAPNARPPSGFLASFVHVIPQAVEARGLDARAVWQTLGAPDAIQDLADSSQRVTMTALCKAIQAACRLTGDDAVVLQAAQAIRPPHLGPLGYALLSSGAGRDGLALYARYQQLVCDALVARHRVHDDVIEVCHEALGEALPADARFWWFLFGARLAFARWVSGRELVPLSIDVPAPRPTHADAFDRFAGIQVGYGAEQACERMPAQWLAWLNPNADPNMHALMQARTERTIATAQTAQREDAFTWHAKAALAELLRGGTPVTLESLADTLARRMMDHDAPFGTRHAEPDRITARQVQSRLAMQGWRFKTLLESVRKERALHLLRDTREPIANVAQACGYTEVSPFHRAVRRWTGMTPLQIRQEAAAADMEVLADRASTSS